MITVAPELANGLDLVRDLVGLGVRVHAVEPVRISRSGDGGLTIRNGHVDSGVSHLDFRWLLEDRRLPGRDPRRAWSSSLRGITEYCRVPNGKR